MKLYKWGVEFFDTKYKKYGGHGQWIGRLFGLRYLAVSLTKWNVGYWKDYYDGWHYAISFGYIVMSYSK